MRRSTLQELCEKYSLAVPKDTAHQSFDDFSAFVDVYVAACEVIRNSDDLDRLVLEVAQDAKKSGAVWAEVAPSLTFYADRLGGKQETIRLLARAAETAETMTGVGMGLVVSIERQLGLSEAESLAQAVIQCKEENLTIHGRPAIVGFGLHGPEEGHPPEPFQKVFEMVCKPLEGDAQGQTIASLPHAGEIAPFPGKGPQSVLDATKLLHAKRIAHGVLADEEAIEAILSNDVCLDVCVSSNYLLQVVDKQKRKHPLPQLLQRGIPCTINSDDPLLFGCSLLSEYELCRDHLELDDETLAQCAKNSFQYSCAPDALKQAHITKIDEWLSQS